MGSMASVRCVNVQDARLSQLIGIGAGGVICMQASGVIGEHSGISKEPAGTKLSKCAPSVL